MKTVKDYLDLGLVFVSGDKICGVTGDSSSNELDLFGGKLCEKKSSKGAVKIGVDCYARARWTPSSFAWRNNDGVKPEYKGVIEAELNSGQKRTAYVSEITWVRGFGSSVAKWRPVVLQSDDSNGYNDVSLKLPDIIYNPELIEAFKSLKGHLESKLPFWNKSMPIFNCPCLAVNIEAIKPAVSPKEYKPMKPVYTAEMHAKGELPPVGSEVLFEGEKVLIQGYAKSGHPIFERENGMVDSFVSHSKFKPITKTIKVNGFDVPASISEAPEYEAKIFFPSISQDDFYDETYWQGAACDKLWLARGMLHSTKSAAIAHSKAMLGIDPNA